MINFSGIPGQPIWPGMVAGPGPQGDNPQLTALEESITTAAADPNREHAFFKLYTKIGECERYVKENKGAAQRVFSRLVSVATTLDNPKNISRILRVITTGLPSLGLDKAVLSSLIAGISEKAAKLPPLQQAGLVSAVERVRLSRGLADKTEIGKSLTATLSSMRILHNMNAAPGYQPTDHLDKAQVFMEIAEAQQKIGIKKSLCYLVYDEALQAVDELSSVLLDNALSDSVQTFDSQLIDSMIKAGFNKNEVVSLFANRKVGLSQTRVGDYLRQRHPFVR